MNSQEKVFHQLGLDRVRDAVLAGAKPSIRLTGVEQNETASSRLGERPNLPPQIGWPAHQEVPLGFVAQLDLAALPAVEQIDMPRTGTLYFFWGGLEMACGYSPNDRGGWQVIYSEGSLGSLPLRDFAEGLDEELRYPGIRLAVEFTEPTYPGDEDQMIEELHLTPAECSGYQCFKAAWDDSRPAPKRRLTGTPSWVRQ
jgi:hypothetical protein